MSDIMQPMSLEIKPGDIVIVSKDIKHDSDDYPPYYFGKVIEILLFPAIPNTSTADGEYYYSIRVRVLAKDFKDIEKKYSPQIISIDRIKFVMDNKEIDELDVLASMDISKFSTPDAKII